MPRKDRTFNPDDVLRIMCEHLTVAEKGELRERIKRGEGCLHTTPEPEEQRICFTPGEFAAFVQLALNAKESEDAMERDINEAMDWAELAVVIAMFALPLLRVAGWTLRAIFGGLAGQVAKVETAAGGQAFSKLVQGGVRTALTARTVYARDNMVEVLLQGGLKAQSVGLRQTITNGQVRYLAN